jgi:enoyl-CoA hydratase/carnithine racemase
MESSEHDGVFVVRIDGTDALNPVTTQVLEAVCVGLEDAQSAGARGVVIAGAGDAFCAGADLDVVKAALVGDPQEALGPVLDVLTELVLRLRRVPFPTASAVEGPAVGVGMSLALATDLRVVARSAFFLPAYLRIGASPDGGLSATLTRAVGGARALSLLIRNQRVRAADLMALGLADESTEDGDAVPAAAGLLARVPPVPPLALVRTRSLIDGSWLASLADQLEAERTAIAELWKSEDYVEGVRAFLEKRSPRFVGR